MIVLASLDVASPLMQILGILVAGVAGAAIGLLLGTQTGRTTTRAPFASNLRFSRDRLLAVASRLEKASAKLTLTNHSEAAGNALVLCKRVSDASAAVGLLEGKAQSRGEEA